MQVRSETASMTEQAAWNTHYGGDKLVPNRVRGQRTAFRDDGPSHTALSDISIDVAPDGLDVPDECVAQLMGFRCPGAWSNDLIDEREVVASFVRKKVRL